MHAGLAIGWGGGPKCELGRAHRYKARPFLESLKAMQLYTQSIARYGKSPYIYPRYGLGELPQGFARLSAIYGGTYMLDKKVDELVMENGVVTGVRCGDEVVKCKAVICDPSYVTKKRKVGAVIRTICLLRHAVPNTNNADSLQLILPMNQVGRKHDIYVAVVSATHNVCPADMWVAIVSTIAETTSDPEKELAAGLGLLGPIEEKYALTSPPRRRHGGHRTRLLTGPWWCRFTYVSDMYEAEDDGIASRIFVSKSYDATSHFQTVSADVRSIYKVAQARPGGSGHSVYRLTTKGGVRGMGTAVLGPGPRPEEAGTAGGRRERGRVAAGERGQTTGGASVCAFDTVGLFCFLGARVFSVRGSTVLVVPPPPPTSLPHSLATAYAATAARPTRPDVTTAGGSLSPSAARSSALRAPGASGGYRPARSSQVALSSTARRWVNASNVWRPLYAPIPDGPTPPNSMSGHEMCSTVVFTPTPPDDVRSTSDCTCALSDENTYSASGLGLGAPVSRRRVDQSTGAGNAHNTHVPRGNVLGSLVAAGHSEDEQDGPKDLFGEEAGASGRVEHERRLNEPLLWVAAAAMDDAVAALVHVGSNAARMAHVDDARIVWAALRVRAVPVRQALPQLGHQWRRYVAVHQEVVGGDARLPIVGKLAKEDAVGGHVQVGCLAHVRRALAPKFKRHCRQRHKHSRTRTHTHRAASAFRHTHKQTYIHTHRYRHTHTHTHRYRHTHTHTHTGPLGPSSLGGGAPLGYADVPGVRCSAAARMMMRPTSVFPCAKPSRALVVRGARARMVTRIPV
jgi:hypothetical protein